jgi:hypothetical protein
MSGFDLGEFIKRIIKYLIEGLIVGIVAVILPKKSLNVEEVVIVGLTAASTFALLDVFLPSVSVSAKNGLGMILGANLGGGLHVLG